MIALSAGHYPSAPGACHGEICEHGEASAWVSVVANLVRGQTQVTIVPSVRLSEKIAWINTKPEIKLVCEIHFNSDTSKRQAGSETLYCPGSKKGEACAKLIQEELGGVFPPSRGHKEGWYQMIRPPNPNATPNALLSKTKPVAIIVEPEFIYNYHTIDDRRTAGCAALASGLIKALSYLHA